MSKINTYPISVKSENGVRYILDLTRKKWLVMTPEEKVRQFFLKYLVETKKYPLGLIATEMGLKLNGLPRRADIVVYSSNKPFLIVECKAQHIKLSQTVIEQVAEYNMVLKVKYCVVTNGKSTYIIKTTTEGKGWELCDEIPDYMQQELM